MLSRRIHILPRLRPSSIATSTVPRRPLFHTIRHCTTTALPSQPSASLLRRTFSLVARGILFTTLGFVMAVSPALPALSALSNPPSDADTLTMYTPSDAETAAIEAHLDAHPLTQALRADAALTESRPHLKPSPAHAAHSLTAGLLLGPGRVSVPPRVFVSGDGTRYAQLQHVGTAVCGHPGVVHGGLLATLLDEALARCSFAVLPARVGLTARLAVDYRAPLRAGSYVVVYAETTRVEGRKAWVKGRIETMPDGEGEKGVLIAEAEALMVSPKWTAGLQAVNGVVPA